MLHGGLPLLKRTSLGSDRPCPWPCLKVVSVMGPELVKFKFLNLLPEVGKSKF